MEQHELGTFDHVPITVRSNRQRTSWARNLAATLNDGLSPRCPRRADRPRRVPTIKPRASSRPRSERWSVSTAPAMTTGAGFGIEDIKLSLDEGVSTDGRPVFCPRNRSNHSRLTAVIFPLESSRCGSRRCCRHRKRRGLRQWRRFCNCCSWRTTSRPEFR